jgi:nitroreductase
VTEPALLDAIGRRYACRKFVTDRALSDTELALVLEAGRVAPSAFGLEPWRFIVVPDGARAAVAHACYEQPAATTAAALVAVVALVAALDPDSAYVRARFAAEKRGDDLASIYAAYREHYRPDTIAAWAQGQCNFAAAQMLLQATHLGLASCPLGGFDAQALARALALPAGETPALVIALGHCAYPAPERLRKPLA